MRGPSSRKRLRLDLDVVPIQIKPLLRGWSHAVAAVAAAIGAAFLILEAPTPIKRVPIAVYGVSLVLLLTMSAVYHLGDWHSRARAVLQRFDHSNIFLFIAATYTPVASVLLQGTERLVVLVGIWACAIAGIATTQFSIRAPRWFTALLYIVMGWGAVIILPQLVSVVGAALLLIVGGGLLYSLGALAYATKRPTLWPSVFGYHEVFHLAVIAASVLMFLFMATVILPYPA